MCMVADAEGGASMPYVKRNIAVQIEVQIPGSRLSVEILHRDGTSWVL